MAEIHLGHSFKQTDADNIAKFLPKGLSPGEYITGIFRANKVFPLINALVITNMRLICVSTNFSQQSSGYKTEVAGDDIYEVAAEPGKLSANLVPLKITSPNGKVTTLTSVRKEDADLVVTYALKTKGRPAAIAKGFKAYEIKENARRSNEAKAKRDNEIAEKAAIIRAFERPEDERTDADKALLSSVAGKEYIKKANSDLVAKHEAMGSNRSSGGGTCPRCGSDRLQVVQEVSTKGVSTTGSAAGCLCLGPIGLLCGLPGAGRSSTTTQRMCLNCGKKFK